MKKTYNNPSMQVTSIKGGKLLADSGIDPQNNQAGLSTKSAKEGDEAGARHGFFDRE